MSYEFLKTGTLLIIDFPVSRLSVILVSRMIFNLREVGTEIHEGTMEWHGRIERETATMQLTTFDLDAYLN